MRQVHAYAALAMVWGRRSLAGDNSLSIVLALLLIILPCVTPIAFSSATSSLVEYYQNPVVNEPAPDPGLMGTVLLCIRVYSIYDADLGGIWVYVLKQTWSYGLVPNHQSSLEYYACTVIITPEMVIVATWSSCHHCWGLELFCDRQVARFASAYEVLCHAVQW